MSVFSKIGAMFSGGNEPQKIIRKANEILQQRGYREVVAVGGQNNDWAVNMLGEDADVWQNIFLLRARMRDLYRTNPYYSKYRELIWANVYGEQGIQLRMKIKETEDRVVTNPREKAMLIARRRETERLIRWACRKNGKRYTKELLRGFIPDDCRDEATIRADIAKIQVGEPDIYAGCLIQEAWAKWQRAEFCHTRGVYNYGTIRQLRLLNCARDGDFFIRMVRSPSVNEFGFALQLINAEWCDYFYNDILPNGNVVRLGVEYRNNEWGIGKPVAYYFIKRQPSDWQFSVPGALNFTNRNLHERVAADEIIHVARYTDNDSTRPAPWGSGAIPKARQLDQFELAEVIAARAAACKVGYLYSEMVPEGGLDFVKPDPTGVRNLNTEPSGIYGLPWGIKYQDSDPTHPNQNFEAFRKAELRSWCAAMPAADYNTIANDLEGINFSAGRLGRLDTNEMSKLIQRWDIDNVERVVFENWLEMALLTQAIKLPASGLEKYNKPVFSGRRWSQVDENKAVDAAAKRIANKISSRTREAAEDGVDFLENLYDLAYEEMAISEFGMSSATTAETAPATPPEAEDDSNDADEKPTKPAPATKPVNGKKLDLNGRLALQ